MLFTHYLITLFKGKFMIWQTYERPDFRNSDFSTSGWSIVVLTCATSVTAKNNIKRIQSDILVNSLSKFQRLKNNINQNKS